MKRGMKLKIREPRSDWPPITGGTTLDVPLYPRSAAKLLDHVEKLGLSKEPLYVQIDIDNFRNQLRAHLERVAIGI